jgi:hypothetical protein
MVMPSSAARSSAPRRDLGEERVPHVEHHESDAAAAARHAAARAASLRTNPSSSIAAMTRATVSGATFSGRLSTFETVPTDTDAAAATSRTLTAICCLPWQPRTRVPPKP